MPDGACAVGTGTFRAKDLLFPKTNSPYGELSFPGTFIPPTILQSISYELVSWSLMSLFSTNMAISETKGQGWKVIRTQ